MGSCASTDNQTSNNHNSNNTQAQAQQQNNEGEGHVNTDNNNNNNANYTNVEGDETIHGQLQEIIDSCAETANVFKAKAAPVTDRVIQLKREAFDPKIAVLKDKASAAYAKTSDVVEAKKDRFKEAVKERFTNPPSEAYVQAAEETVRANIRMFSGCADIQTSADVTDTSGFEKKSSQAAAADYDSEQQDRAASAKNGNKNTFFIPPPPSEADKAGGACTNALLFALAEEKAILERLVNEKKAKLDAEKGAGEDFVSRDVIVKQMGQTFTFGVLLSEMRRILKEKRYTQIPQLCSSKNVHLITENFNLKNPALLPLTVRYGNAGEALAHAPEALQHAEEATAAIATATKTFNRPPRTRALLIGISYKGIRGAELDGCINDVRKMKAFLIANGFSGAPEDMRVLADDESISTISPTGANIIEAMHFLVDGAQAGDSLFFHFSGHGSQQEDEKVATEENGGVGVGDEADGFDETLVPLDYQENGMITDDTIFQVVVAGLPEHVYLVCLFDCCHSGTMMDLPFIFSANDQNCVAVTCGIDVQMEENPAFSIGWAKALMEQKAKGAYNQLLKARKFVGENAVIVGGSIEKKLQEITIFGRPLLTKKPGTTGLEDGDLQLPEGYEDLIGKQDTALEQALIQHNEFKENNAAANNGAASVDPNSGNTAQQQPPPVEPVIGEAGGGYGDL